MDEIRNFERDCEIRKDVLSDGTPANENEETEDDTEQG